jgi:hypothetical protein
MYSPLACNVADSTLGMSQDNQIPTLGFKCFSLLQTRDTRLTKTETMHVDMND